MLGERTSTAARIYFGGMSGDWLRKLERTGVIPKAPRTPNGYRHYPLEYIEQIKPIVMPLLERRQGGE